MKILITGAAGFIGSHLVDLLLEEGIPLSSLRLFIPKGESLDNLPDRKFDIVRGDIRDRKAVKTAMRGIHVVYHLAAKIDFDGKTYADYEDVNVRGTQNLLDECRHRNIRKFIFFSSIAVFGLPASVGNIIHWDERHSKTYTNFYGRSKWEAEERVLRAYDTWKVPYAIIRPASVYGPREKGPTLALYRAIKHRQFLMIGNGKNKMHYVYVTDLVRAARLAQLSTMPTGDYIIAGPNADSLTNVTRYIAESIHASVPNFSIPKSLALAASYVMEHAFSLIKKKSPLYPSRVRTMTTTYYYSIDKAKRELRYDPKVHFRKGAQITGQWYLKHNYL